MSSSKTSSATRKPTLKALQTKLKSLQTSFNTISRFVNEYREDTTVSQISIRLERLDDVWEKMLDLMCEVEVHEEFVLEEDVFIKERADLENHYYDIKSFLMDKMKELTVDPSLDQTARASVGGSGGHDHVRLPQIKLQSFDGNIDEWLSFRDLFTSLIHWKQELPEVEKLHYLKGCLEGEARAVIEHFKITKGNYQLAWEALLKRYNNNKLLKKRQVQSLFKLPSLPKESVSDLHKLLEKFERTVQTLDQLVQPADYRDLLLIEILSSHLDPYTRRGWEEHSSTKEEDTLKDLTDFVQRRIRILESLPVKASQDSKVDQMLNKQRKPAPVRASHSAVQSTVGKCLECSETHFLHQCPQFQKMSTTSREAVLRKHNLCRNCLRKGHQAASCQSKFSCRKCKARHHTMVCFKKDGEGTSSGSREDTDTTNSTEKAEKSTNEKVAANVANGRLSNILLATAVVIVEDDDGATFLARALLDSGAEGNFVTERLYQQLNVAKEKIDISVVGIGQASLRSKHKIKATIKSRVSSYSQEMSFLVLPKVTVDLPTSTVQASGWELPDGVELADPTFFHSRAVDLVLGIQHFFNFFQSGKAVSLGDGLPRITESVFGWLITGEIRASNQSSQITCNTAVSGELENLMSKFWSCEEVGACDSYTPEQKLCEEQFAHSFRRDDDGRYVVEFPRDHDKWEQLGESKVIATRSLLSMERRLARNADLHAQYQDFMRDYLDLGHMHMVDADAAANVRRCYLPHHAVIKESSTTTKLRVVFNASAKTSTGVSLNDALLAGPIIQSDLRDIVLRSRMRLIMVVSDVEKMFRQINMAQADMPFQSILYRFDPRDEIATYELSTVTYGTKSAPFLATRALKQLADDERKRYPLAARAVDTDVYMDDVISGADDVETATELRVQLDEMLSSGGFMLRKWASNKAEVLRGIPKDNLAIPDDEISWDQDTSVTTLGLTWLPKTDCFKFKFGIPSISANQPLTKRKVLSAIATFFDPLGLIGAAIIPLKIFMQKLWILRSAKGNPFGWDEPLPPMVGEEWRKLSANLAALNDLRIPRCTLLDGAVSIEFHCFSDASEKAYGTCVYIRSKDATGKITVRLLTSKSRVAPIKTQSLPRLELCGALLAAETMEWVQNAIRGDYAINFWSDSTCVLGWLKGTPGQWHTFVANRVAKIQGLSKDHPWNHVPGVTNPADLISRGVEPENINNNKMWWEGPPWLMQEADNWPRQPSSTAEEEPTERRHTAAITAAATTSFLNDRLSRYSSFTTLLRATALAQRYIHNLSQKRDRRYGFVTTQELRRAEEFIIRLVQLESFSAEIDALNAGKPLPRRSRIRWFNPIISSDGLLRVGGRLNLSSESQEVKQPIVLPAKHWFTKLLLRYYHTKLLHAGPQLMLAAIRQRYWPLGGKDTARQIVHQCQRCYRLKPKTVQQKMGDLPKARVTAARPFAKTGVDYFGPVYIKVGRGRTPTKAYVAIFVCMAVKAVHMELVGDLSTESFLQALRRFISRRNRPTDIYSDNGTNFVGAKNQMQELLRRLKGTQHNEQVAKLCVNEGINWHFNPPSAPHFGGLWEASVRSAKHHLLRVLGENSVSFEDFNTLLTQVEACLNSRPLTALSNDPTDPEPLTPAHFLTGESLQALPDVDYTQVPLNRLSRYQHIQRLVQDFWKRWRREYLVQLQSRTKNYKEPVKIEVGKLVVIVDNNQPPLRWKTGRIHELHPGEDGVVRVVTLRLSSGLFMERAVEKLCILPSQEDDSPDQPEPSPKDD